jgi:hypothetical protein
VPPKLDGQADDPCWQNTVACADFLVGRSLAPAQEKTTARLCYDDQNLYLLFVCDEPLLNPVQQRRHEFVARVQERDGEVYQDDSCVVLLDPANTGKQVFDFTVNALGTVADARCPGPDLWETRDLKWNSQAQAVGQVGDAAWIVEMSIPFADLSGQAPRVGDAWQSCLGRIARARKEYTSWNPSNRGFHDPYVLGTLIFAGPTVGVTLSPSVSLQLGKSHLSLNFSTGAAGRIRMEIQDEQGQPFPGFALDDGPEIFGDALDRTVPWKDPAALKQLAGKPVRLRFELCDADLYAFQFRD